MYTYIATLLDTTTGQHYTITLSGDNIMHAANKAYWTRDAHYTGTEQIVSLVLK